MKTNHKLLIISLSLFFVSFLLLIYSEYFIKKPEIAIPVAVITSTIQPSPAIDTTTGWKIYTDNVTGFSINYPNGWTLVADKVDKWPEYSADNEYEYSGKLGISNPTVGAVNLMFGSGFGGGTCSGFGGKLISVPLGNNKNLNCQLPNSNGSSGGSCGDCGGVKKGNTGFVLNVTVKDITKKKIIDQILSTFKFTDITNNSIPDTISNIFSAINKNLSTSFIPTEEDTFFAMQGDPVNQKSWKLDVSQAITDKSRWITVINTLTNQFQMKITDGAGGAGESIDKYENNIATCYLFMNSHTTQSVYLSCAEK